MPLFELFFENIFFRAEKVNPLVWTVRHIVSGEWRGQNKASMGQKTLNREEDLLLIEDAAMSLCRPKHSGGLLAFSPVTQPDEDAFIEYLALFGLDGGDIYIRYAFAEILLGLDGSKEPQTDAPIKRMAFFVTENDPVASIVAWTRAHAKILRGDASAENHRRNETRRYGYPRLAVRRESRFPDLARESEGKRESDEEVASRIETRSLVWRVPCEPSSEDLPLVIEKLERSGTKRHLRLARILREKWQRGRSASNGADADYKFYAKHLPELRWLLLQVIQERDASLWPA